MPSPFGDRVYIYVTLSYTFLILGEKSTHYASSIQPISTSYVGVPLLDDM